MTAATPLPEHVIQHHHDDQSLTQRCRQRQRTTRFWSNKRVVDVCNSKTPKSTYTRASSLFPLFTVKTNPQKDRCRRRVVGRLLAPAALEKKTSRTGRPGLLQGQGQGQGQQLALVLVLKQRLSPQHKLRHLPRRPPTTRWSLTACFPGQRSPFCNCMCRCMCFPFPHFTPALHNNDARRF